MILTLLTILSDEKMSGEVLESSEEGLVLILPEKLPKVSEMMPGEEDFASNILFASCKMEGRSTNHEQISNVFSKFSN